jgi:hypothetical protein
MLIGPPSSGKTELLLSLSSLANVFLTATLTESALLSGTKKEERGAAARGGLLKQIGDFGIIVFKDFTSILSMHRDPRAAVLAALREIYDGRWMRRLGVDGGTELKWEGKVALLAGCTPTIDSHHAVIGSMGERFVFYRLPDLHEEAERAQTLHGTCQEFRV